MVTIIAALDENRVIGKDKGIPFRDAEDMRRFKELTTNNVVVMGRKTWESLPDKYRPLPDRHNIVLTKKIANISLSEIRRKNGTSTTVVSPSFNRSIEIASMPQVYGGKEIFIIGGAEIYAEALKQKVADKMILTYFKGNHDGDAYFPLFESKDWSDEEKFASDTIKIVEYKKI